MTQQELANDCGLSRFQISRWETGETRPTPGSLKQLVHGLAKALNGTVPSFGLADLLDDY
jgi:transcriptional regulator with XRE-family HTH domain